MTLWRNNLSPNPVNFQTNTNTPYNTSERTEPIRTQSLMCLCQHVKRFQTFFPLCLPQTEKKSWKRFCAFWKAKLNFAMPKFRQTMGFDRRRALLYNRQCKWSVRWRNWGYSAQHPERVHCRMDLPTAVKGMTNKDSYIEVDRPECAKTYYKMPI